MLNEPHPVAPKPSRPGPCGQSYKTLYDRNISNSLVSMTIEPYLTIAEFLIRLDTGNIFSKLSTYDPKCRQISDCLVLIKQGLVAKSSWSEIVKRYHINHNQQVCDQSYKGWTIRYDERIILSENLPKLCRGFLPKTHRGNFGDFKNCFIQNATCKFQSKQNEIYKAKIFCIFVGQKRQCKWSSSLYKIAVIFASKTSRWCGSIPCA